MKDVFILSIAVGDSRRLDYNICQSSGIPEAGPHYQVTWHICRQHQSEAYKFEPFAEQEEYETLS